MIAGRVKRMAVFKTALGISSPEADKGAVRWVWCQVSALPPTKKTAGLIK